MFISYIPCRRCELSSGTADVPAAEPATYAELEMHDFIEERDGLRQF